MPAVDRSVRPEVKAFDPQSNTISYAVKDRVSPACAAMTRSCNSTIASGRLSSDCADEIIGNTKARGLTREWIIETHVHADHLSGALYIFQELGGKIGISEHIHEVQDTLGKVFNEEIEFERGGS